MPTLDQHQSTKIVKMLLIGDSGTGKTGSLASLVNAGYKLRVLDYDNGLDALFQYTEPAKRKLVDFVTLTDKLTNSGGEIVPLGPPMAYVKGIGLLQEWKYAMKNGVLLDIVPGVPMEGVEVTNLGKITEWGPDTVFVLDSLTFFGNAILRYILALASKSGKNPEIQHWGGAMDKQEKLLEILYSDAIRCHVIVCSHVTFVERDEGGSIGYPSGLGSKLPPKIPRYFNTILQTKTVGVGPQETKKIFTKTMGLVQLKSPVPSAKLSAELPIATGLADYFTLMTGTAGPAK